jgi:hypothetical protein
MNCSLQFSCVYIPLRFPKETFTGESSKVKPVIYLRISPNYVHIVLWYISLESIELFYLARVVLSDPFEVFEQYIVQCMTTALARSIETLAKARSRTETNLKRNKLIGQECIKTLFFAEFEWF